MPQKKAYERATDKPHGKSQRKNSYFNKHTKNELTNTLVDSQFPFSPALIAAYKCPCVVFLLLFFPICSSSFVFHPAGECVWWSEHVKKYWSANKLLWRSQEISRRFLYVNATRNCFYPTRVANKNWFRLVLLGCRIPCEGFVERCVFVIIAVFM